MQYGNMDSLPKSEPAKKRRFTIVTEGAGEKKKCQNETSPLEEEADSKERPPVFTVNYTKFVVRSQAHPAQEVAKQQAFMTELEKLGKGPVSYFAQLHSIFDLHDVSYIALRKVDGPSLEQLMTKYGQLDLGTVVRLGIDILRCLFVIHYMKRSANSVGPSMFVFDTETRHLVMTDFSQISMDMSRINADAALVVHCNYADAVIGNTRTKSDLHSWLNMMYWMSGLPNNVMHAEFSRIRQFINGIEMRPKAAEWSLYGELENICRGIAQKCGVNTESDAFCFEEFIAEPMWREQTK